MYCWEKKERKNNEQLYLNLDWSSWNISWDLTDLFVTRFCKRQTIRKLSTDKATGFAGSIKSQSSFKVVFPKFSLNSWLAEEGSKLARLVYSWVKPPKTILRRHKLLKYMLCLVKEISSVFYSLCAQPWYNHGNRIRKQLGI